MSRFGDYQLAQQTMYAHDLSQHSEIQTEVFVAMKQEMRETNKKAIITTAVSSLIGALVGGVVCALVLHWLKL